ncbi:Sulfite exporter TauE/SafE [Gammaproteobacteria bacterium MOLA455]|nr:Sulfite exporter TauE/SafE [Gammaproteobacteria bacterium MOLA455]
MDLSTVTQVSLVGVAFFAGLLSSIAGSGGILTLPALLWAGLPPLNALATNKVQSAIGTLSSAWNFFRQGHIDIKPLLPVLLMGFIGSVIGTLAVQQLDSEILLKLIPFLLIAIAAYFLLMPKVSEANSQPKINQAWFACTAGLGMGFYGGFFGPAMGSIFPFLLVWLMARDLVTATAETKLMIVVVNGTSALLFIAGGHVVWGLAIAMSVAQMIGARLGSNLVMKRGSSFVQPVITIVTLLMAVKLLFFV